MTVADGQAQLDPSVQRRLLDAFAHGDRSAAARPTQPVAGAASRFSAAAGTEPAATPSVELPDGLTSREAEVLGLIAGGLSNREIAATLYVTEATVKTHINRIFAKTGARRRAQLVVYAFQQRISRPL
jgi:DNA-binding NarL/FixJ family response regulator